MKWLAVAVATFLLTGAGPDLNRCSWWLKFLGEVSTWEEELIKAREAHDWNKAKELELIIRNLQKRGGLEEEK